MKTETTKVYQLVHPFLDEHIDITFYSFNKNAEAWAPYLEHLEAWFLEQREKVNHNNLPL